MSALAAACLEPPPVASLDHPAAVLPRSLAARVSATRYLVNPRLWVARPLWHPRIAILFRRYCLCRLRAVPLRPAHACLFTRKTCKYKKPYPNRPSDRSKETHASTAAEILQGGFARYCEAFRAATKRTRVRDNTQSTLMLSLPTAAKEEGGREATKSSVSAAYTHVNT
jgi:hypothetical protein